jgi:MscS family membrane protein
MGVMMILNFAFNLNVASIITGLSIVGAAIALALRESLENLIASFVIFFDRPFTTGDIVKVKDITGTVEKIGLRSTRIRSDNKTYVTVANKQMVDSILDNISLRTQRRGDLQLEISLTTPASGVGQLLQRLELILKHKEIQNATVHLSHINSSALIVVAEYYTAPIALEAFNGLRQEINLQSLQLLEDLKIELAGANTHVHLSKQD